MSIPKIIQQHIKFVATLVDLPIGCAKVITAPLDDAAYHADGKSIIERNKKLKAAKSVYIYTANQILASGEKQQYAHFFVPMDDPAWELKN